VSFYGVLAVTKLVLVLGDLPFQLVNAPVHAGIGVAFAVVGDECVFVLGIYDNFHGRAVLAGVGVTSM
jgi:hypothetical protein